MTVRVKQMLRHPVVTLALDFMKSFLLIVRQQIKLVVFFYLQSG